MASAAAQSRHRGLTLDLLLFTAPLVTHALFGPFRLQTLEVGGLRVPLVAATLAALALPSLTRLLRFPVRASDARKLGGTACFLLALAWWTAETRRPAGVDLSMLAFMIVGAAMALMGLADRAPRRAASAPAA